MPTLRLFSLGLVLVACRVPPMDQVSRYVCPDGTVVQAGVTHDRRLMLLALNDRTYTLRQDGNDSYASRQLRARRDDLFLHLGSAGLPPRHCRLLLAEPRPETPSPHAGPAPRP
jgi:hypothetical protein